MIRPSAVWSAEKRRSMQFVQYDYCTAPRTSILHYSRLQPVLKPLKPYSDSMTRKLHNIPLMGVTDSMLWNPLRNPMTPQERPEKKKKWSKAEFWWKMNIKAPFLFLQAKKHPQMSEAETICRGIRKTQLASCNIWLATVEVDVSVKGNPSDLGQIRDSARRYPNTEPIRDLQRPLPGFAERNNLIKNNKIQMILLKANSLFPSSTSQVPLTFLSNFKVSRYQMRATLPAVFKDSN